MTPEKSITQLQCYQNLAFPAGTAALLEQPQADGSLRRVPVMITEVVLPHHLPVCAFNLGNFPRDHVSYVVAYGEDTNAAGLLWPDVKLLWVSEEELPRAGSPDDLAYYPIADDSPGYGLPLQLSPQHDLIRRVQQLEARLTALRDLVHTKLKG